MNLSAVVPVDLSLTSWGESLPAPSGSDPALAEPLSAALFYSAHKAEEFPCAGSTERVLVYCCIFKR